MRAAASWWAEPPQTDLGMSCLPFFQNSSALHSAVAPWEEDSSIRCSFSSPAGNAEASSCKCQKISPKTYRSFTSRILIPSDLLGACILGAGPQPGLGTWRPKSELTLSAFGSSVQFRQGLGEGAAVEKETKFPQAWHTSSHADSSRHTTTLHFQLPWRTR